VMSGPAFSTIRSDNVTLIWFNRDTMAIAMLLRKLVREPHQLSVRILDHVGLSTSRRQSDKRGRQQNKGRKLSGHSYPI
jgi:hypothetical protein